MNFASDFSRKHHDSAHVEGVTREQFAILEEGSTHDDYLWFIPVGMEWDDVEGWIWPSNEDMEKDDASKE
jgi:hypothetical protein